MEKRREQALQRSVMFIAREPAAPHSSGVLCVDGARPYHPDGVSSPPRPINIHLLTELRTVTTLQQST